MQAVLLSLQVGRTSTLHFNGKPVPSAFVKRRVAGAVWLAEPGLDGDEQADLKVHGGPDKAVCVYPGEHYAYWAKRLGRALPEAAFGENFTARGLTEETVYIGDIFRIGEATVEVSQPRQPCFKLAARHEEPKLALWVQETGFTGFYLRCLEAGHVRAGDVIDLIQKSSYGVSVVEANRLMHRDKGDVEALKQLLGVPALSANWRSTFEKRLAGEAKDVRARLQGLSD